MLLAAADGGWEPKLVGESTAAGSFRRRGSGRSRSSVGATRSRGTKHSTGKLGRLPGDIRGRAMAVVAVVWVGGIWGLL